MSVRREHRFAAALAGAAAFLTLAGAVAQPRAVREFATIDDHDPSAFAYAVRYGADLVKRDPNARFTLLLGGRAVLLVVPGANVAQRDFAGWRQGTGDRLRVIACSETMQRLRAATRSNVPVIAGASVQPCDGRANALLAEGWQRMLGM